MSMKLIVAIVQNDDADDLIDNLTAAHFGATRLASTGGFLRTGNTTIMVGVPEDSVEPVLKIIAGNSLKRKQNVVNPFPAPGVPNISIINNSPVASPEKSSINPVEQALAQTLTGKPGSKALEIQTGRATVFVLNLDRYERV